MIRTTSITELSHTLKLLCQRFPNHGIAIQAITKLIVIAIRTPETSQTFLDCFIPVFAEWMNVKNQNRLLHALSIDVGRKILHRMEVDTEFAERISRCPLFLTECQPEVQRYETILGEEFGGTVPHRRSEN
jgi:hypothetical protein